MQSPDSTGYLGKGEGVLTPATTVLEQNAQAEVLVALPPGLVPERPTRKIAIFGTTPSRMEGPWQEGTGWERWTIGPGGKDAHGWERLYEVHGVWPEDFKDYLNDLSKVEPPRQVVTLPQPDKPSETWAGAIEYWKRVHNLTNGVIEGEWKAQVPYPRDEILAIFRRRMWFSSSISWLIAQAIYEGATDIGLFGIDLESGEEYISQFVGCAHLIDLAQMIGINIYLPKDSGLQRDINPYPDRYETHLALQLEKKAKWLEAMAGQTEVEYEELKAEVHRLEGRLLTLRAVQALREDPEFEMKINSDTELAEKLLIENNRKLGQVACSVNTLKGELNSCNYWRRMYVWGVRDPHE